MPAAIAYDFLAPPTIVFGWGRRGEIGKLAGNLATRRAFLVVGSRTLEAAGAVDELRASLAAAGLDAVVAARIAREPEVVDVDHLVGWLRAERADAQQDLLVAVGGGAAIDLAKAAAALVAIPGDDSVVEYLEGVGRGRSLDRPGIPLLAMPTTGGTGSEATKNAVISSYDPPFKKSLRSPWMVPRAVLIDPELSVGVSPATTAASGMDALTQCIESYISRRRQPVAQALAAEGLRRAVPALPVAVSNGADRPAREAMAHAALLSGMALANSGLGMAHGVAAALGVQHRTPHGLACAVMLPLALRTNRPHCEADMARLARCVWDDRFASDTAAADALVARITRLARDLGIPERLRELGVRREHIPHLVAGARGNSLDGNPVTLSGDQLNDILEGSW
jgi:alcohol dehydrogenase class IV